MPYCKIALTGKRQVADLIGVTEQTISNWEGQHSYPALIFIPGIIKFLGRNPLPETDHLAQRLVRYRTSKGITQKALAKQLGIDPTTLARWERGDRTPTGLYRKLVETLFGDLHKNE